MNRKLTKLIIVLILGLSTLPLTGHAQIQQKGELVDGLFESTLWTYQSKLNRREKYSLRKIGSQVTSFEPMTIDIKNVRVLLKITDNKNAKMVLVLPNKQSHTLTSKQIKQQLIQKMIPGIQDSSLIYQWVKAWKNRKILSGEEKSSFTKNSSFQFKDVTFSNYEELKHFSIFLLNAKDTLAEYRYIRVDGSHVEELPKYENAQCEPFDRETVFSRCDDAFQTPPLPIRYQPELISTIKREFTIYFDHNSFTYPQDKLTPLIEYLAQSDHQLTSVKISSYSSIEGDSANNILLMKKRGEILKEIVSKLPYKIPEITLYEAENWALLEQQIESENLPTLSKEDWKRKLENDTIADSLEYLLRKQRYAKIQFSLKRPKTRQEQAKALDQQTLSLWTAFDYFFDKNNNRRGEYSHLDLTDPNLVFTIRKLVGLLYYAQEEGFVEQSFKNHYFESEFTGYLDAEIMVYLFYQPSRFHLGIPKEDLLLSVFNTAKKRIIELPESPQSHKIFNDVQKVIFNQVANSLVDSSILEQMEYPPHPGIDPYNARFLLKKQEFIAAGIIEKQATTALEQEYGSGQLLNSEYYRFLKSLVLENTLNVLPNTSVRRTDWYLPFDQYELLSYQNEYWDVYNDQRFDPEVSIATQWKLLKMLMKKPGNLCRYNIEHLAVDFFHKLLIYAEINNNELYAQEAIDYLMPYYKRNKKYLNESELKQITSELYSINRYLYYGQVGQWAEELRKDIPKSNRTSHL